MQERKKKKKKKEFRCSDYICCQVCGAVFGGVVGRAGVEGGDRGR